MSRDLKALRNCCELFTGRVKGLVSMNQQASIKRRYGGADSSYAFGALNEGFPINAPLGR